MSGNDTSAGATPAVDGATPSQTTPVSPATAAAPTPPATGDGLGEGGRSALDKERTARREADDRASALQKRLEALEAAGQSDTEKAIAQARKDGAAEVRASLHTQIRTTRVESALTAAGVDPTLIDLAAGAAEFAKLKVTDDGAVEGLAEALEALKKARPSLFRAAAPSGTADGGTRGAPALTRAAIAAMSPDEVNARWEEVSKALAQQ